MPAIIDSKNVGEYIKKLLREHSMTQEELSRKLNISKSAVSQNLNGKSTFDIQNLMHIAEIFDISLDQLMHQKNREPSDTMSEYERLVVHDQSKISLIEASQIKNPDLYGKFMIEYVMEHGEKDLFKTLINRGTSLVDKNHSRYSEVVSRMLLYMIENSVGNPEKLTHALIEHEGSLVFKDSKIEEAFYTLVEKEEAESLRKYLLRESVSVQNRLFGKIPYNQNVKILPRKKALEIIFKYNLKNMLATLMDLSKRLYDFEYLVNLALEYDRKNLLESYLSQVDSREVRKLDFSMRPIDEALLKLRRFEDTELFLNAFEKGFYDNPNNVMDTLIKEGNTKIYDHLLSAHKDAFNLKSVSSAAVHYKDHGLLKTLVPMAKPDTLNFMLAETKSDDVKLMKYLIRQGANFDINHYRRGTYEKINTLLSHLLKGDDAS